MVYLLDTNAVSDLRQPNANVDARLAALAGNDRAVICPIVRGEILYGVERLPAGKRKDDFRNKANRYSAPSCACHCQVRSAMFTRRSG